MQIHGTLQIADMHKKATNYCKVSWIPANHRFRIILFKQFKILDEIYVCKSIP